MNQQLHGLRCIGLTRSSSKAQAGDGLSNDQQLHILKTYAIENQLIWIDEERAEGLSGSDENHRPDLDNLIYRAETERDYDVLLVTDFDRLTRAGSDHGAHLVFQFAQLGVFVVSTSNDINLDDEYASLLRNVEFIKGEGTAKSISKYTTRGSSASLREGRMSYTKQIPYGIDRLISSREGNPLYRIRNYTDGTQVKLHVDNDMVIETYPRNEKTGPFKHFLKGVDQRIVLVNGEKEAVETVQLAYDMFWTKGIGVKTIAAEFNRRGIPSPRGKTWSQTTVYGIVKNPIYVQRGVSNRMTNAKFHYRSSKEGEAPIRVKKKPKNKSPKLRPLADWIITNHPRIHIIDPELHETIWQKQFVKLVNKANRQAKSIEAQPPEYRKSRFNSKYLLHGSIYDAKTGVSLTPYTSTRRYYAVMTYYNNPHPDMKGKRKFFSTEAAEKAVLECFGQVMQNLGDCQPLLEQHAAKKLSSVSKDVLTLSQLRAERDAEAKKKLLILDHFSDVGEDLLLMKIGPMTAKLRDLDARIEGAERAMGLGAQDSHGVVESVMKQIRNVGSTLGEPTSASLRSALHVLTRTVVDAESGEAEIELRLPEEVWRVSFSFDWVVCDINFNH